MKTPVSVIHGDEQYLDYTAHLHSFYCHAEEVNVHLAYITNC